MRFPTRCEFLLFVRRSDDGDVLPRAAASPAITGPDVGSNDVPAGWQTVEDDLRRARRPVAIQLDLARSVEVVGLRRHFQRSIIAIDFDHCANHEVAGS